MEDTSGALEGKIPGANLEGAALRRRPGDQGMRLGRAILVVLGLTAGGAPSSGRSMVWGQAPAQGAPAGAQQPSQAGATAGSAESSAPTIQVYSREAVVDVTVMDAKGQPVHGLTQADFTISEDGKPQQIRSFKEYSRDTPPEAPALPKLPPNVYTNIQPPPASSSVNILLLDALNTAPADMVYMKQESMRYLKGMPKGTRIAVLGLSSRLTILQGLTSDPAVLQAAIDTKKNRALPSPFIDNDSAGAIDASIDLADDGEAAILQQFENDISAMQQDIRNRMTLEALNQIAAYVSGIKGRKNLIWFTDGMPLNIFPDGGTNDLIGITDYSKDLRKTTDLLTAAEVAVYPVDARGLFNNPAISAAVAPTGLSGKNAAQKGAKDAEAQMKFAQKTAQEQLGMEAVAEATGGVAYYNTNDLKTAVSKAIENGANYYGLSYVPPSLRYDGRYHSISVKVDRPGVKLAYRTGYNADDISNNAITPELTLATTAPEPYGNNMAASMGRGVPTSSQLLFDVRVQPTTMAPKPTDPPVMGTLDEKLATRKLVRYDFEYVFPARELSFSEAPGGVHKGSVEFDIVAYDVYGKRITSLSQTLPLPLTASQYAQMVKSQTPFRFFQQIDLPPGEMFIRVGVLDGISDKVGTMEIPLTVSKKPAVAGGAGGI
jgi:VWFA-related protein